jgi:hypothetical protein
MLTETQGEYAVYLLDPGPQGSGVVTLLQEVTGGSVSQCAEILQTSPAFVVACRTRGAADDVVARFREFGAIAVVRPVDRPLPERTSSMEVFGAEAPPAIPWALAVLAVLQIGVAAWWIADHKLLAGIAGLLLGGIILGASLQALLRARR